MYTQSSWASKIGDELSLVLGMLPLPDIAQARAACAPWSRDMLSQRSLLFGRLADLLVARIKKTKHIVPAGSLHGNTRKEESSLTSTVVDERMPTWMFDLLFGSNAFVTKPDGSMELVFSKPSDVVGAIPGLPVTVFDVRNNAPNPPLFPLRCWAGYADGHINYSPANSQFSLVVRSRVLKLGGYWEKTPDAKLLKEYLES